VGKKHGQTRFLHPDDLRIFVFFGEGIQVNKAWDSCGDKPRTSQNAIDAIEYGVQD
jgi:hypothetical protein